MPHFDIEKEYWEASNGLVAGLDEVGRGSIAGPVVVGAVIFKPHIDQAPEMALLRDVNDSKKLPYKKRAQLFDIIKKNSAYWGIGSTPADVVDRIGIRPAITLSAESALHKAPQETSIMSDWKLFKDPQKYNCREIPKGDAESITIAAASILAKVWRDTYMERLSRHYRLKIYDWQNNKGYGTKAHRMAIASHGASFYHRKTFLKGS